MASLVLPQSPLLELSAYLRQANWHTTRYTILSRHAGESRHPVTGDMGIAGYSGHRPSPV